jgi:hypothetical protein
MATHEQPRAFSSSVVDPGDSTISNFTLGLSVASLAAVILTLAALIGGFTYATVAQLAGIHDARAGQTTELFAGTLIFVWTISTVLVSIRGSRHTHRGVNLADTLMLSDSHRRLWSGALGIGLAALLAGVISIAVASSRTVTPPWAWIAMTLACFIGAVASIRITDALARRRANQRNVIIGS